MSLSSSLNGTLKTSEIAFDIQIDLILCLLLIFFALKVSLTKCLQVKGGEKSVEQRDLVTISENVDR